MFFDLPLEQLHTYQPLLTARQDFDAFWAGTLNEAREKALAAGLKPHFTPVSTSFTLVEVMDVTFPGYAGQLVKGWLILPKTRSGPLPCVVEYIGYGGGRGLPIDWLFYANQGYAHFVMDTRGQGSAWSVGDTPDLEPEGSNAQYPGFMTRGILSPKTYYYRRVFTDAVQAVEAARSHPAVDARQIAVTGGSQGGGISLAAAGLAPGLAAVMPDVPFLCNFKRATDLIDSAPYSEIPAYCKNHRDKIETVFETLSYFDGMNFAVRSNAPALFSVGLMDEICPPSTVFSAYNHYHGPKEIKVWPYNHHEGGQSFQNLEKMRFLETLWGR